MSVYVDSGDCERITLSSESILVMGEVSKQLPKSDKRGGTSHEIIHPLGFGLRCVPPSLRFGGLPICGLWDERSTSTEPPRVEEPLRRCSSPLLLSQCWCI